EGREPPAPQGAGEKDADHDDGGCIADRVHQCTAQPLLVYRPARGDDGLGAEVGGKHREGHEAGAETAPGQDIVGLARHPPRHPRADGKLGDDVGDDRHQQPVHDLPRGCAARQAQPLRRLGRRAGPGQINRMNGRCGNCRRLFFFVWLRWPPERYVRQSPYARRGLGIEAIPGSLVSAPLHPLRPAISCLTAAALVLAQIPALRAASAMTRAEYEACQARDENGFRSAIELLTRKGLEAGLSGVDYKAMLAEEWRRGNVDDIIDREVDRAIGEVREESSWFKLWSSLASREKAQELATTAAERVYRSEPVKKAIEQLAAGIGKDIGKRIELATIDSAAPATQCIQAFLGARYGATIARVVADGAGREYTVDPTRAGAQVSTGQVLIEGREGIAGTVVLVVRRQLANMAARIGQRIVGSILSKLVSVVASGVGLVLIAKDIWDFRHGVLPIVAGEMKS